MNRRALPWTFLALLIPGLLVVGTPSTAPPQQLSGPSTVTADLADSAAVDASIQEPSRFHDQASEPPVLFLNDGPRDYFAFDADADASRIALAPSETSDDGSVVVHPVTEPIRAAAPAPASIAAALATGPSPTEPSFVAWAQSTLAAVGAAAQVSQPLLTPHQFLDVPHWATVATVHAPQGVPSSWLTALAWTVLLASLGLALPRGSAFLLGLYARLTRSELEDQPRRALLLQAIRAEPGIHMEALRRLTQIPGGALRHHLQQLADHGLARRVRRGRTTHWFDAASGVHPLGALTESQRRVFELVRARPGLATRDLARALSVRVQSVWKHLVGLADAGVVEARRHGATSTWYPRADATL